MNWKAANTCCFFMRLMFWKLSKRLLWMPMIFEVSRSFLTSSSSLLNLALRFWNQVITWALVRPSVEASSSRSAAERYFWYKNLFSSSNIWKLVNAVRDFLFFLAPPEPIKLRFFAQSKRVSKKIIEFQLKSYLMS